MISHSNKEFNKRMDALIKAKHTMPLSVYIAKMKALKAEISASLVEESNNQHATNNIMDQVRQILNFKLK